MDPCPFVRLVVESLVLKLPVISKPAGTVVHPSATPCFCSLQLADCPSTPTLTTPLPVAADPTSSTNLIEAPAWSPAASAPAVISLDPTLLNRLAGKRPSLAVSIYLGRTGSTCGFSSGRLLGRVRIAVDLEAARGRPTVAQSGWVSVGTGRTAARLHLVVRSEPDPRFVFQFGGEPECSPVVYQIQRTGSGHGGCIRQPVFSCRFSVDSRRSTRSMSASMCTDYASRSQSIRSWFGSLAGVENGQQRREQRKGWTVTIHDLSGFPVAAASMVTPFVPSPGSDRVSRSNPGAWLILRASSSTNWKPWGRLEAWREHGPADALGYRFELVPDVADPVAGVAIAEAALSVRRGGQFCIDPADVAAGAGQFAGGFVMGSTVEGEGRASRPTVQVGVRHVSCMADVALFVALAAAVDLSMDACQLFSQRLRKELTCQEQLDYL